MEADNQDSAEDVQNAPTRTRTVKGQKKNPDRLSDWGKAEVEVIRDS